MRCPVCGIETSVFNVRIVILEYTNIDMDIDFEREVHTSPERERTSKDISRFEMFCKRCDSDITHLTSDGSFEEIALQVLREKGGGEHGDD